MKGHRSWGVLLGLAADTMLFTALLAAMIVLRMGDPLWRTAVTSHRPSFALAFFIFGFLILSCFLFLLAAREGSFQRKERQRFLMRVSMGFGFLFVVGQIWLLVCASHAGLSPQTGTLGTLFYVSVGLHVLHVLSALVGTVVFGRSTAVDHSPEDSLDRRRLLAACWVFLAIVWVPFLGLLWS